MMRLAVIFGVTLAASLVLTGCGNNAGTADTQANAAPPGSTKAAGESKNGAPTAKGLSPKDLTPPAGGGTAQFGSKTGGDGK